MDGIGHGLIKVTISAYIWKNHKKPVKTADFWTEVLIHDHPNTKQESNRSVAMLINYRLQKNSEQTYSCST
jgi:hypothetical protein